MTTRANRKPIGLALQGGGSWGAYTWGVLDALLASREMTIAALSGTSAGAINAAILASALARGRPAEARSALRSFWHAIAEPGIADLGFEAFGPIERHWRETVATWLVANGGLTPYDTHAPGVNPLREAVERHVDIEALRSPHAPPLHVTVTHVKTGLPRVFGNDTMSVDVLLASACLPQLFQAVEIDGEPYWDGGYHGNPTLWPLIRRGAPRDLVVVQLSPETSAGVPRDAASIRRRVGEIVFHSSLVAELRSIAAMREVAAPDADVRDLRLHRIGPPPAALQSEGSALERSPAWIERLRGEGHRSARRFLDRHARDLGVRETLDIATTYAGAPTRSSPTRANAAPRAA
jgi:NTE family protein